MVAGTKSRLQGVLNQLDRAKQRRDQFGNIRFFRQSHLHHAPGTQDAAGRPNHVILRLASSLLNGEFRPIYQHYNVPDVATGQSAMKVCLGNAEEMLIGDVRYDENCPYCRIAMEQHKQAEAAGTTIDWRKDIRANLNFLFNVFLCSDVPNANIRSDQGNQVVKVEGVFLCSVSGDVFRQIGKLAEGGEGEEDFVRGDPINYRIKFSKETNTAFKVVPGKQDTPLTPSQEAFITQPTEKGGPYDLNKTFVPENQAEAEAFVKQGSAVSESTQPTPAATPSAEQPAAEAGDDEFGDQASAQPPQQTDQPAPEADGGKPVPF